MDKVTEIKAGYARFLPGERITNDNGNIVVSYKELDHVLAEVKKYAKEHPESFDKMINDIMNPKPKNSLTDEEAKDIRSKMLKKIAEFGMLGSSLRDKHIEAVLKREKEEYKRIEQDANRFVNALYGAKPGCVIDVSGLSEDQINTLLKELQDPKKVIKNPCDLIKDTYIFNSMLGLLEEVECTKDEAIAKSYEYSRELGDINVYKKVFKASTKTVIE